MDASFFDRLEWRDDRVVFDNFVFRLESARNSDWDLGDECFSLYKGKGLVDQYARFWRTRDVHPSSILEIGLWEGGSVAFWNLFFEPQKHVGIDRTSPRTSSYFDRFVASRGGSDRIATCWGVDQADARAMRSIVDDEFSSRLDLVIDDGSHLYGPTKASFEILFPLVRPGGLYVIEDWAWAHWKASQSPRHRWAREIALTKLICELVEATGSSTTVIADLSIFQGFTVVERGSSELLDDFELERHIVRRPPMSRRRRMVQRARYRARRLVSH